MGKAWQLHRRLCRVYGVNGPGVMSTVMGRSDLNIVYTSRHFQPCADTFDERFHFVGPLTSRIETATFPWERLGANDIVYISLGTLFNTDLSFYRNCFEAFGDQDVQVILSIGTEGFAGELRRRADKLRRGGSGATTHGASTRQGVRDARRHEQHQRGVSSTACPWSLFLRWGEQADRWTSGLNNSAPAFA